ncbi:MAG: hypothetical protein ACTJHT_01380 [Sphingobacterium sp.]|uniref:hypothetical protein n=1 Tax=Sphingobacterium sp. JB170 TaxID=1434842 RepID=UPI00097EFFE5|nr:hypothetical protein [Sphingobacterium sp. JB170]SJN23124.1 hypothetical protein FM107_03740 [Sphingobacterium sp. JB170]
MDENTLLQKNLKQQLCFGFLTSDKRAIATLAKNGIQVNEDEVSIILDFVYLVVKNYNKPDMAQEAESLMRNRPFKKDLNDAMELVFSSILVERLNSLLTKIAL